MASDAQKTLYEIFAAISGSSAGGMGGLSGVVADAVAGSGSQAEQTGSSAAATAGTVAMDVLKSGFGLVTLVSSLFGAFGGGEPAAPLPLVKYALPAQRDFQAAETSSGMSSVDYGQSGLPRAYDASGPGSQPQINVTVQAMDARSFLDRSSDIAAAVRQAMLNLNPINDVVNDL
jgi:hypothetical protein